MKVGRVVGIDDGYFVRGRNRAAPLVGVVMKGPIVEDVRFGWVTVDGDDVDGAIVSLISDLSPQVGAVFLYGTIFAGTNVVSLETLYESIGKPVIAVADEKPDEAAVMRVLHRQGREKIEKYTSNPPMEAVQTPRGTLYLSYVGATRGDVLRIVKLYQLAGKVPEPLRLSHIIGRSVGRWASRSSVP